MKADWKTHICVIGAGAGGLSVAAGAAQMGMKTTLIEAEKMGGDCLNTGCVPSKALLAAAKHAHLMRKETGFGVAASSPHIDFPHIHRHVQERIAHIAPHDSVERFEGLGVRVVLGKARFLAPKYIEVETGEGKKVIRARKFVIASGARPAIPDIKGLGDVPFFTSDTIFTLSTLPAHLAIIGAGPIGCEMAQAFIRLGAKVSLFAQGEILPREDRDLAEGLQKILMEEGVHIYSQEDVVRVSSSDKGIHIFSEYSNRKGERAKREIFASHVLCAIGRRANIDWLEGSDIPYDEGGVIVNHRLQTAKRHIYALGDVVKNAPQFTHAASYQAGIILRNIVFHLPARVNYRSLPHVTYTDPELASIGLSEAEARKKYKNIKIITTPFAKNDRAICERKEEGFVKLILSKRGRVLGVGILAHHGGDLLVPWEILIRKKLKLSALAGAIMPYPSRSEASKAAASQYYAHFLFSKKVRLALKLLNLLG